MFNFLTGALEAMLLCFVALMLFTCLFLVGWVVTWMFRGYVPSTPSNEGDDLGGLDAMVPAGRLTDVLPTKYAAFPNGDQMHWLDSGFLDDWEDAFAKRDWRAMGHALKLADQILFQLWRTQFEKSADMRPPIKGA